jgi:hypothetical protein
MTITMIKYRSKNIFMEELVLLLVFWYALPKYHSRFVPEGVAVASQIFLRDAHILSKLLMRKITDVTGGKPIAV